MFLLSFLVTVKAFDHGSYLNEAGDEGLPSNVYADELLQAMEITRETTKVVSKTLKTYYF